MKNLLYIIIFLSCIFCISSGIIIGMIFSQKPYHDKVFIKENNLSNRECLINYGILGYCKELSDIECKINYSLTPNNYIFNDSYVNLIIKSYGENEI